MPSGENLNEKEEKEMGREYVPLPLEYLEEMAPLTDEDFGKLVVYLNNEVTAIPLEETAGKLKYVDPDCQMIKEAKSLGISFGD